MVKRNAAATFFWQTNWVSKIFQLSAIKNLLNLVFGFTPV